MFNLLGYIIKLSANEEALAATENPDPPLIKIGPVVITTYSLTLSLISAGCSIPVTMIIALLFQQRRMRKPKHQIEDPYSRFRTNPQNKTGKFMFE